MSQAAEPRSLEQQGQGREGISQLLENPGEYEEVYRIQELNEDMPSGDDVLVVLDYPLFPLETSELEYLIEVLEERSYDFVVPPGRMDSFPRTVETKEKKTEWIEGYGRGIYWHD